MSEYWRKRAMFILWFHSHHIQRNWAMFLWNIVYNVHCRCPALKFWLMFCMSGKKLHGQSIRHCTMACWKLIIRNSVNITSYMHIALGVIDDLSMLMWVSYAIFSQVYWAKLGNLSLLPHFPTLDLRHWKPSHILATVHNESWGVGMDGFGL